MWTAFFDECGSLLGKFIGDSGLGHFTRFSDKCMDIDPVSMAMALSSAVCTLCGNGEASVNEECDEGAVLTL